VRRSPLLSLTALLLLAPAAARPANDLSATVERYCTKCHNPEDWAGGLDLSSLDPAHVNTDAASWEKVVRKLRSGMMPPPGKERPTRKEAEEYYRYYADELADWGAVDNLMRLQGLHAQSFPEEALRTLRGRFAAGHGTYPLVGDPDTIVREMTKIPAAGFAGCTLSFVDYVKEFPIFAAEILPRLERLGLRQPVR